MDKKKIKLLIILGSIVVVLGVALAIVLPILNQEVVVDPVQEYTAATEGKTLSNRTSTEVEKLVLTNENGVFTFSRDASTRDWYLEEDSSYTVYQSAIDTLAKNVAHVYGVEIIAENKDDLFSFGLMEPTASCYCLFTDGQEINVSIGDIATVGNSYYVMTDTSEKIVRCVTSNVSPYLMSKTAFHDRPSLALEQLNLTRIEVIEAGDEKFSLEYKEASSNLTIYNWQITYPFVTDCDSDVLETILTDMSSLTITDAVDAGADVDLSAYGLAENQRTEVTFRYSTGESKTFYYGSLTEDGTCRYITVPDDDGVYTIAAELLDFINISPASAAGRLLAPIYVYNVDKVIFDALGESAEIEVTNTIMIDSDGSQRVDSNGDYVYEQSYKLDGVDIQRAAAVTWYKTALYIKVHSVLPESAIAEDAEAVGYLKYVLNDRVDGDEVLLEFVPYGYDYYALRINGVCYFSILRDDVQDIADNLVALRNGDLDEEENIPFSERDTGTTDDTGDNA